MNLDLILGILQIVLIATTPLVFAGIGELVTEKSGVLNLGVEGMMLVGAVSAFIILVITGSYFLAFFCIYIIWNYHVWIICFSSSIFNVKSNCYRISINYFWNRS